MQQGAGVDAHFPDAAYADKGATLRPGAADAMAGAELVAKVQAPTPEEVALLPEGITVVSFFQPGAQLDTVRALVQRKATAFSLDLVPRISRAQSMDALSSQATVSGYLSTLAAAERLPKFFPMFMTAAGTIPPAKVLVLGAGVAGLQAIATARRLGAQVRAYDVRAAAKEEVQSLGRQLRGARARVPGGRGRLRPGAVRGVPGPPARADQQRGGRRRRGHHHRGRPRPPGPGPRDHGHGRAHGRGVGHRRHGRRQRRQLRGLGAGPGHRPPRRDGVRALQPALGHAHPRQLPVLAQRRQLPGPHRGGRRVAARLRRRDRGRQLRGAGRRGRPRAHRRVAGRTQGDDAP